MKKWEFREPLYKSVNPDLAEELCISPILLKILCNRGYADKQSIEQYLDAPLKNLTHPDKWPLIPQAAEVLAKELLAGKKLAVWGDYDVDGITATALVLDVLEHHGFSVMSHLPDRMKEGYGLNCEGIESLAKNGCQTLLTVDCGISDAKAINRANELGITVILSDHHLPPANLPKAAAIVNPRISDAGAWPCEHLAGVGVAFFLMAQLNRLLAKKTGRLYKMDNVLDLAALGTLADVMLLTGENRIIARGGLAHLSKPLRAGIKALKVKSGFELYANLNSTQAVFRLAPRLNAAGRMCHPVLALNLLRASDYTVAEQLAHELDIYNSQRKSEESRIYKEASKQANELLEKKDYSGLVLAGKDWHPGIVGIVASRIVEEFNRPAIILCEDNEFYKGSGRSIPSLDLYNCLKMSSSFLISFGGHKQAAGLRLLQENLENFRNAFSLAVRENLGDYQYLPSLLLEGELPFQNAMDEKFVRELELLEPFGPGNPEPVFASYPLIIKEIKPLGYTGEHVLLILKEIKSGLEMRAKAWRMAHTFTSKLQGAAIRIAYTPVIDSYNGIDSIGLAICDWQKA